MSKNKLWLLIALMAIGLLGYASIGFAAHPNVTLKDVDGSAISSGSSVPYSPKQTCSGCHFDCDNNPNNGVAYCTTQTNDFKDYESHTATAKKDHGVGSPSYDAGGYYVPYPQHGVTTGFHFQQGRSAPWGDIQRTFYSQPAFTSSPGMFGKICPPSNRQLADVTESNPAKFEMSAYDFAYNTCGWCHPGGGSLEYDRSGYRYDGKPSGLISGTFNPDRGGTGDGAGSGLHKGDYYQFVPGSGIVDRSNQWRDNGVAEADCMICHISGQRYANLERNYVHLEPPAIADDQKTLKGLKYSATIGLSRTSLITGVTLGSPNTNPSLSSWQWAANEIPGTMITKTPDRQNCSVCHFPDKSWFGLSGSANRGPIDSPLGFTSYQKMVLAGTVTDDDEIAGVGGKDGKNDVNWPISNGRVEGGKRGESINDAANPDAHMDNGFHCAVCHTTLQGTYGPKTDSSGNVIAPQVTVEKIDHQFAKGDAFQDTKGMDQLDYTATCESCHITYTHPNVKNGTGNNQGKKVVIVGGTEKVIPVPTHPGLPSIHLNKIACKTCHIPVVNGPMKQLLADFTVGPFRGFARTQAVVRAGAGTAGGIGYRPLKAWQVRKDGIKIVPHGTMAVSVWANGGPLEPTFQRAARAVAMNYRNYIGDNDNDGVYDWPLNRPNGGRTVHIVNDPNEISAFVARLNDPSFYDISGFAPVSDPILNIYNIVFSISHNIQPITRDENGKPIPGPEKTYTYDLPGGNTAQFTRKTGPLGINGCIECHSSSDSTSPNYSPKSVGFFDREHVLYFSTTSLTQTCTDASGNIDDTCSGTGVKKRVRHVLNYKKSDGSANNIDLGSKAAHGQTVPTTVNQCEVLGICDLSKPLDDPANTKLAKLTNPNAIPGVSSLKPKAKIKVTRTGNARGLEVSITDQSVCPSGSCTRELKVDNDINDNNPCDPTETVDISGGSATYTFTLTNAYTGQFCAQMTVTDNNTGLTTSHVVPIRLVKKNEKPIIDGNKITVSVDENRIATVAGIAGAVSDSDDASTALQVRVVWGDGTVTTVAGDAGSITKPAAYPNKTKTYNVRVTVIDTRNARAMVTVPVQITATP